MTSETERTESSQFPPLLTRKQYFESLPESDQNNLKLVLSILQNTPILESLLETKKAGVFAVGTAAIPRKLLGREPADIDLRIVVDEEISFHKVFLIMREIHNTLSKSFTVEFKVEYIDSIGSIDAPVAEFKPEDSRSRKIDVILPPFETVGDELQELLEGISKPDWKSLEAFNNFAGQEYRETALKEVYIVQLL